MLIGVDIGGTFTDVVCIEYGSGNVYFTKVSTNYRDIIQGVVAGVQKILKSIGAQPADVEEITLGTTIATNVVVQRKGARTALLTTQGFEDVLEIGRLKRRRIYDINIDAETPVFLCPRRFRIGVPERVAHDGNVLLPLDEEFVASAVTDLRRRHNIEAIAVCYLYSFSYPRHEQRTGEIIKALFPELFVSLSSEVSPRYREFERTMITTFDAYMRPAIEMFMHNLERVLSDFGLRAEVRIMQSRGGVTSTRIAAQRPINLFLSGPAGGVVGAARIAESSGYANVITLDIGGTSSDVALVSGGRPTINANGEIADYTVPVSMVGVSTIGAGGGSVLWIDAAGLLRVGPRSAGSDPGPACYGRGGKEPTLTDASLVLGYLNPVGFAGGELDLDVQAATDAVSSLTARTGLSTIEVALGAHRIMNIQTAEQIRLMTIKRGFDPREFALMPFGGAGPLHAGALMSMLGTSCCLVPSAPGVLSAFGLLSARFEVERTVSFLVMTSKVEISQLSAAFDSLSKGCLDTMRSDKFDPGRAILDFSADLRYRGQSYEITVPVTRLDEGQVAIEALRTSFEDGYRRQYGFSNLSDVEIVTVRAVARLPTRSLDHVRPGSGTSGATELERVREVWFLGEKRPLPTRFYHRAGLTQEDKIMGPSVIEQADTTILVYPGQVATVDTSNNIIINGVAEMYVT